MTTVISIISRSLRLVGQIGATDTPDAGTASTGLIAWNAMKRSWFGPLIGPRLGPQTLSGTSGQAENGGEYQIAPTAAFTLTAPSTPKAGARFGVVDPGLVFNTYACTVARNGQSINGAASNYVINTAGANTRFWFRGDTGNWVIEADSATINSTVEFPDVLSAYFPYMLAVAWASELSSDVTPEIMAADALGRQTMARMYGRRGRSQPDGVIGLYPPPAPAQGG